MDRIDSVARRIDRSLAMDVVFAVAGPIALGTALGMLLTSWTGYGNAVAARPPAPHLSIERGPVTDVCDEDDDDADDDDSAEANDDDDASERVADQLAGDAAHDET